MKDFIFPEYTTAEEVKKVRKRLGMTQREFASFISVSKPTLERWESSGEKHITGPVVTLLEILKRNTEMPEWFSVPEKRYPMRLWYMFEKTVCTIIDVDEAARKISIKNYVEHPLYRAFGVNEHPVYSDYVDFLKSRCFPETRDKMKIELEQLGLPFYDPLLIIEKTEGRMADDHFWIRIERQCKVQADIG